MTTFRFLAGSIFVALATGAQAVHVSPDGLGQALIFPYYTVRSGEGGAFNTYLSIVNSSPDDKALRVRFREGRNGRAVASFNVYLGRNDAWAVALVPSDAGTRLVTVDRSCVEPALPAAGLEFSDAAFSGAAADGAGTGLDRTREGYVEVLEMATLVGSSAVAMTHFANGLPASCERLLAIPEADVRAPTGGLSGTLTLINVADGSDYSVNAEALAALSRGAFFRQGGDAYPGFEAAEIEPVSVATANGVVYRSRWPRALDAVSAALMRTTAAGDYALETTTRSRSELFYAFPTRPMHVTASQASAPFLTPGSWSAGCQGRVGEQIDLQYFNRGASGRAESDGSGQSPLRGPAIALCSAAAAIPVTRDVTLGAGLTGSTIGGYPPSVLIVGAKFENGWMRISGGIRGMTSLPESTRLDVASGTVTSGAHVIYGLPLVGFAIRSLRNGTLSCQGAACQGNYGSAFPMRYTRNIAPAP